MIPQADTDFAEFDRPGDLSVVVQGGLFAGNMVETANNCAHWRHLFPAAEIILSLSSTDMLTGKTAQGRLTQISVTAPFAHDSTHAAALKAIQASCDKVLLSRDGILLPPIKSDAAKPNNINLQIAAAKNGLHHATGRYVLRVRSDLLFMTRDFLDQYRIGAALPRGDTAVLASRVLISWLYTLNPYTVERLPLHLSDWFHFGTLEDVRALWKVPFVSLSDAIYYHSHPHARHSNATERVLLIRLADEQHLAFNAFKDLVPGLKLDYHNDHSGIERCMDVLVDNFTLCDLTQAHCVFPKYQFEFDRHERTIHCLTPRQWRALVDNRQADYRHTLADVIEEGRDRRSYERKQPFPRVYEASRLFAKTGHHVNGVIVGAGDGVLSFGPHVTVPRGRYIASVDAYAISGRGQITIKASLDHGATILASRTVHFGPAGPEGDLTLPFEITSLVGSDFEIVCETRGLRESALRRISIAEAASAPDAMPTTQEFVTERLLPVGGMSTDAGVVNLTSQGELASTPFFELAGGNYNTGVTLSSSEDKGVLTVSVESECGNNLLAERRFDLSGDEDTFDVAFAVPADGMFGIAVHCSLSGAGTVTLSKVAITPAPPGAPLLVNPVLKFKQLLARLAQAD